MSLCVYVSMCNVVVCRLYLVDFEDAISSFYKVVGESDATKAENGMSNEFHYDVCTLMEVS